MDLELIRTGLINGVEFSAFISELPTGKYMASLAEVGTQGFGSHNTKTCDSKEEAIAAIDDLWAELEKLQ